MTNIYNGALTREQFLFYEIRIVAKLTEEGASRAEIAERVRRENLFQFPTERTIGSILSACFKRLDALGSPTLISHLANAPAVVGKQIDLYAMMRYNRIVWDLMTTVIGEKYRTQDLEFSKKDLDLFFFRLREQNDAVAVWSDLTVVKIKQVLKKSLLECGYLDPADPTRLEPVTIAPELEDGIRENNDLAALPAFNCFR